MPEATRLGEATQTAVLGQVPWDKWEGLGAV